jgi:ferredoxin
MTMESQLRSQVLFHLGGRHAESADAATLPRGLRPALMAPYRRLNDLRHDFPCVLLDGPGEYVVSLSALVDGALRAIAPQGPAGEALRQRALQLETRIRHKVAAGERGQLKALWQAAALECLPSVDTDAYERDVATALGALACDGELLGCDAATPTRFLRHAWAVVQREKARAALARIEALTYRLETILRADHARSPAALAAESLQATFGPAHRELFDFTAMSRLLNPRVARGGLSEPRRRRIESALSALRTQRFFAASDRENDALAAQFVFEETGAALDACRRSLPEMVALHRALQVAELEADGRYVEATHDPILTTIDAGSLGPADLQFFPDFLVCVGRSRTAGDPALLAALSSGLPLKVLVPLDDVLEITSPGCARFAFGVRGTQLGRAAMSLDDAFVLQTAASNLLPMRDAVQRGLRHAGAALFVVYAGPAESTDALPPYLSAAAALQSRVLPTFVYDPGAGPGLAERFSLATNPQVDADWPIEPLDYADPDLQAISEDIAFTAVDFALCDARYSKHFSIVPRSDWGDAMVPAAQWLRSPPVDPSTAAPYVVAVDDADLICRLVVDEPLMRTARRCQEHWYRLQELAGVHDSRIERAVAREREALAQRAIAGSDVQSVSTAASTAVSEPAPVVAADVEPPARDPDVASVETLRCSSCNECTLAFPKLFAYNDDKQAYLRDVRAGTYRQLVEAAESCQVSVIHPGKPWNPDEPGLEELLERAKPFR